jgi:hypothetical protein
VLEVWQGHAGPRDLPRVIPEISPNQLTQDRMQEKQTLKIPEELKTLIDMMSEKLFNENF